MRRHPTQHGRLPTARRHVGEVCSKRRTPMPRSPTRLRPPCRRRSTRRRPRSQRESNRLRRRPTTHRSNDEPTPPPRNRSDTSLSREFRVGHMRKRPFFVFRMCDFAPTARIFWNNGYRSADAVRDMRPKERDLIPLETKRDARGGRSTLSDLRLILKTFLGSCQTDEQGRITYFLTRRASAHGRGSGRLIFLGLVPS